MESTQVPLIGSAVVDELGRLFVPKPIRDKVGLSGRVTLIVLGNGLLLLPQQQEFEARASNIQSAVLRDGETVEDILAQLPAAGRESFIAKYGEELTAELEGELCPNE
ncbi:hypothetical protein H8E77_10025 [bacterium]|nr:hypothetical protein [bacterium]